MNNASAMVKVYPSPVLGMHPILMGRLVQGALVCMEGWISTCCGHVANSFSGLPTTLATVECQGTDKINIGQKIRMTRNIVPTRACYEPFQGSPEMVHNRL